jgi:glycosyltransferase involved in cell wall biosynthesis
MIRTLHIDIEGGYGGSSRSLFELVSRLPRDRIEPFVSYRQDGPARDRYVAINVETIHVPEIGSYVPRQKAALKNLLGSAPRMIHLGRAAHTLARFTAEHSVNVIHLNYEGLFLLAPRLKQLTGLPLVCHHRALVPDNLWGRWLVRTLCRCCDYFFFISPQEEHRVRTLEGDWRVPGEVLWNIAPERPAGLPAFDPPKAVYLGNVDPQKGTDRILDIAAKLDQLGAPALRIAIYGEGRTSGGFFKSLANRIDREQLSHRVTLEGFTSSPEEVLVRALALIRPSRANDPWGRDVIEATAFGVPVIATGCFDGVVRSGVTGWLHDVFDAEAAARQLIALVKEPELRRRMGAAAREKGARKFNGAEQATRATAVFEKLANTVVSE